MEFQANDKIKHIKSGLKGRVVASADKNPEGKIVAECPIVDNGQLGYKILTELPSEFELIESIDNMFSMTLPLDNYILDNGMEWLLEKVVKHQGVWAIHKYDADDNFPSDLHAHRKDEAETMDLYTGDVYDAKTKNYLRTLSKKAMNHIYAKLMKCKEEEIKQKFIDNADQITYLKKKEDSSDN